MIFYFSGTGNSRFAAENLQDSELINIGEANKKKEFLYTVSEGEAVGIVCPVYYTGLPKPVLDFIRKLELTGPREYVYAVFTHGGGPGGAGAMLQKELAKKGIVLNGCFDVEMTSNYIMFKDLRSDERLRADLARGRETLKCVAKSVEAREKNVPAWSKFDGFLTSCMMFLCDKNMPAKKFYADEGCTGCGMCQKNCPAGIIEMDGGKPKWTADECVRCMSCLSCAHVQYGNATGGRRRYLFDRYK